MIIVTDDDAVRCENRCWNGAVVDRERIVDECLAGEFALPLNG